MHREGQLRSTPRALTIRKKKNQAVVAPVWRGMVTFKRGSEQSKPYDQIDEAIGDISGESCPSLRELFEPPTVRVPRKQSGGGAK